MADAGRAHGLLNTFLRLNKSHKRASMNIISDSDGHLQVTITVTIVGQADQAPRKGGRQSNNRERGPGTRVPSPGAPSAPSAPYTPSPAPAKRAKRRGPGALLRDERRRLARIEPGLLIPDSPLPIPTGPLEGATSGPLPPPSTRPRPSPGSQREGPRPLPGPQGGGPRLLRPRPPHPHPLPGLQGRGPCPPRPPAYRHP